jgi:hypothetical protein
MRKALLTGLAFGLMTAGAAWAQQSSTADQGCVSGPASKLGTGATGGAPGATAAVGTQGGPAPDRSKSSKTTTEGQGVAAMAAKAGTGATGGAFGVAAATGTEAGCPPDKALPSGEQGGG